MPLCRLLSLAGDWWGIKHLAIDFNHLVICLVAGRSFPQWKVDMGETAGVFLFLLSCLAVLWSVAGLIRPRIVVWWAVSEKQTRGRACSFALFAALTFFFLAMTFIANAKWWIWLVDALCLVVLFCAASLLRTTKKELQEFMEAQGREEKARLTRTAFSSTSDKEYEIRPFMVTCTCRDWEERRSDAEGPFAVCKHLANHYACQCDEIPESLLPYKNLFLSFSIEGKGIPPQGDVFGYGVVDGNAYLFTGYADSLPWVNVYTDYGTEQFRFNITNGRWARDNAPQSAEQIAIQILNRRESWKVE